MSRIGKNVQASIDKGMLNVCSYCGRDVAKLPSGYACDGCGDVEIFKCGLCGCKYLANHQCRDFTKYCLKCFMEN